MQSHWTFNGQVFSAIPESMYGFIYKITNIETGKSYIGRKQFISITRKRIKNRTNRKVIKKETNWREYTGSCIPLNKEIQKLGKDKFKFEILALAETKGQLNFLEVCAQIKNDVLIKDSYNDNIGSGMFRNLKITPTLISEISRL